MNWNETKEESGDSHFVFIVLWPTLNVLVNMILIDECVLLTSQATTEDGWNCIECSTGVSPTDECNACADGQIAST